jgi:arylsulfatase A-like enzyme
MIDRLPDTRALCPILVSLLIPLGLAANSARAEEAAKAKRPNILFIYTDDHSYRTVGCYEQSYPWVRTPTIDSLARQGVRFQYAYIGTWCMPSRATLLTGHHQFGVESMRMVGPYPGSDYDAAKCPFWPKVFREHGYVTAQIGKWHTGVDTGYGRDWDFQIVWNRPKHPENHQNYYYDQPVTHQGGETKIMNRYSTDQYTDWAIDFLKGQGRDESKPWYLWLCYGAVHSPYTPAPRHLKEFPGLEVPTPADVFPPRPGKPDWEQKINFWEKGERGVPMWQDRTLSSWVRQYHQGVLAIDENIKRLLKTLDETGQRDNTLIVFTSDQGFAWGQHGFRHKVAAYDSNIRSPMIISFPGRIPEGEVCPTPVGGVDIVPTIFRFAGIDLPWEMHGHDLTPLLENPRADWPHPMMLTATGRSYGSDTNEIPTGEAVLHGGIPWYVMLRQGNYKYVRPLVEGDIEELYDLKKDPEELDNLAIKPMYAKRLKAMRQAAIAELRRTGAGFVDNMPPVRSGS